MTTKGWRIVGSLYEWIILAALLTLFGIGIWKVSAPSTGLWAKALMLVVLGVNFRLIQIYRSRDQNKIAGNIGRNNGNG